MPTFQVTCTECGEERWPTLPERPTSYMCARCTALEPAARQRRKDGAAKRPKPRPRLPNRATGAFPGAASDKNAGQDVTG